MAEGQEAVAEGGADAVLDVVLLGEQLAYAQRVALMLLQAAQLAPQRGESGVVRVIDIEVCDAGAVWVEQGEDVGHDGHGQRLGEAEGGNGRGRLAGEQGQVLYLEQFHLVERGVRRQRREGALQVVELHEAVPQVVVGATVTAVEGGVDGAVAAVPFRLEGAGVDEEVGVEHRAAAGRRHEFHAINDILKSGVLFDELSYLHCGGFIFITS